MSFWNVVEQVMRNSNVVLLIMDARMPDLSKNKRIEDFAKSQGKMLVYVFNKIDLISEDELAKLKSDNPNAFFVAGIKNLNMNELRQGLKILAKQSKIGVMRVGVVGYPNVGKSSIINALARRARTKVAHFAGTTRGVQWVRIGRSLKILDSPGVIPIEDRESDLAMLGSKDPEKVRNKEKAAIEIIKGVMAKNPKALEDFFGIKIEGDEYEVFLSIGKKRGFLKKGGIVDDTKTSISIIRDWQKGKLRV